jgi:ATP-dependent Clp protease, protease subunit
MSVNQAPKRPPFVSTRLLANGTGELTISGAIDTKENTGSVVVAALRELEAKCKAITIVLNCYGGAVSEGLTIIDAIQQSTSKIATHVSGIAASMGAFIWFAGATRTMAPHALIMTHQPSTAVAGKASDLREAADMMDGLVGQLADLIGKCLAIEPDYAKEKYLTEKDRYIRPEEATALGLCTKIEGKALKAVAELTAIAETEEVEELYSKIVNHAQQGKNVFLPKPMLKLFAQLGLSQEATEDEATAKVTAIVAENARMQQQLNEHAEAKVVALVAQAIADKKIGEAQKEAFTKLATQDFDSTSAVLAGMTAQGTPAPAGKQKSIAETIAAAAAGGTKSVPGEEVTYESLSKKNPEALGKMQSEDPEQFAALFKAQYGKDYKPY